MSELWSSVKTSSGNRSVITRDQVVGERLKFRIAPVNMAGDIVAPYSAESNGITVRVDESGDSLTLLVGIGAGGLAFAFIVAGLIVLVLRRNRRAKALKVVSKKEFVYNPQPYSLHYGQHIDAAAHRHYAHR